MKQLLLTLLTCLLLLSPNVVLSEEQWDLMKRDGIYYKKFNDVPFSGEITGNTQVIFKNGKKEGSFFRYSSDGQLIAKGNYRNGKTEGVWVNYHDNGQVMEKSNYKNGKLNGAHVYYYSDGRLSSKGNYKNGEMDGDWVDYNKDGTVDKDWTGNWKNGDRISD
jgi:antitoxin component YwqK of YwqJK toxin-antitoxin module